jgi:hypothetical protein
MLCLSVCMYIDCASHLPQASERQPAGTWNAYLAGADISSHPITSRLVSL